MTEADLTIADKAMLKKDIKISFVIGLLFCVALVLFVGIIPGLMMIFGKQPSDGFFTRGLSILGLLFIPFVAISWKNVLKFIDIKKGKKLKIESVNYHIKENKNSIFIETKDNQTKRIKIWEELLPLLNLTQPLKIEITTISKTIIFISNNSNNLLDE